MIAEFIETPTFTRMITALLTDDEYWGLQNILMENLIEARSFKEAAAFASCAMQCKGTARAAEFE